MKCDNFNMKRPCPECPYTKAGVALFDDTHFADISGRIAGDDHSVFICHKTLKAKETSGCMGALAYQWKYTKLPVLARFAISAGMLKLDDIKAVEGQARDFVEPIVRRRKRGGRA